VTLSAVDLLNAWEVGLISRCRARAPAAAGRRRAGHAPDAWAAFSIGCRDMALLDLYAAPLWPAHRRRG
jgi:hypothetical protein